MCFFNFSEVHLRLRWVITYIDGDVVDRKGEYNELAWHSFEIDEILLKLKANKTQGLSQGEARERLRIFGTNTLPEPKRRSILSIIIHQRR